MRVLPTALAVVGSRGLSIAPKVRSCAPSDALAVGHSAPSQVRRVIGIWRERGVLGPEHSDSLTVALDDPDAFLAAAGTEASALLLGATFGVLGGGDSSARSGDSGGSADGGGGSSGTPAANKKQQGGGAVATAPMTAFYGTGFASDFVEMTAPPGGWGSQEEGSAQDAAAAAAAAQAQAASADREAAEEETRSARPATPLAILEQAAAGLLRGRASLPLQPRPREDGSEQLASPLADPLLTRFLESLETIDSAEGAFLEGGCRMGIALTVPC